MARPIKHNADYFSHDNNMRYDPKIRTLVAEYGGDGYMVFCYALEFLTGKDYFKYKWNDANLKKMAHDFGMNKDRVNEIINYLVDEVELLQFEDDFLICERLIERMAPLLSRRKNKESLNKRNNNTVNDEKTELMQPETHKVKESKEKESKIEKRKEQDPDNSTEQYTRAMKALQKITVDRYFQPNTQDFCYSKVSHICNLYKLSYKECADKLEKINVTGKPIGYIFGIFKNESLKNPDIKLLPPEIKEVLGQIKT